MPLIAALFLATAATLGLHAASTGPADAAQVHRHVAPHHHHHRHHAVHHHAKAQAKAPVIVTPATAVTAEVRRDPIGAEIRRQDAEAHAAPVVSPEAPSASPAPVAAPAPKGSQLAPHGVLGPIAETTLALAGIGTITWIGYCVATAFIRPRRPVITRRSPKAS